MADDTERLLRDSARSLLAGLPTIKRLRAVRNAADGFDRAGWQAIAELGWLGLCLPEAVGGSGLGLVHAAALGEEMGVALAPEPWAALAVQPAMLLGGEASLAARLSDGSARFAVACQESANPAGPEHAGTLLMPSGAGFLLSGRKLFVPTAADVLLVACRLEGEPAVVACAPPAAAGPVRLTDGSFVATMAFDRTSVSPPLLRGAQAGHLLTQAFDAAAVVTAAYLTGLARAALEATLAYMRQRRQFGQPIASFQALRHRAVDLHLAVELAGASWRRAAQQGGSAAASAAKARAADTALSVGRAAIQLHGAIGFTEEADIGLYLDVALRHAAWLGNAAAHRRRFLSLTREPEDA